MRITIVEISQKTNVQNKLQFWKVLKHCKSHIQSVSIVGNDYLNYVCHCEHDVHHRSWNFEKQKVEKKLEFRKISKRCKSDIHCVFNIGNDDLNYVCIS